MMQQTKGLGGCRKNPWPQSKIDSGASAIGTPRAPGGRVANSGSALRRQHASARGAQGHLSGFSGQDRCTPLPTKLDTDGGSSPRAGAALHCFYCCDRGSTQLAVGEIPAQQCGGLQVADLAERSGVP
jgi:hypothetical protein